MPAVTSTRRQRVVVHVVSPATDDGARPVKWDSDIFLELDGGVGLPASNSSDDEVSPELGTRRALVKAILEACVSEAGQPGFARNHPAKHAVLEDLRRFASGSAQHAYRTESNENLAEPSEDESAREYPLLTAAACVASHEERTPLLHLLASSCGGAAAASSRPTAATAFPALGLLSAAAASLPRQEASTSSDVPEPKKSPSVHRHHGALSDLAEVMRDGVVGGSHQPTLWPALDGLIRLALEDDSTAPTPPSAPQEATAESRQPMATQYSHLRAALDAGLQQSRSMPALRACVAATRPDLKVGGEASRVSLSAYPCLVAADQAAHDRSGLLSAMVSAFCTDSSIQPSHPQPRSFLHAAVLAAAASDYIAPAVRMCADMLENASSSTNASGGMSASSVRDEDGVETKERAVAAVEEPQPPRSLADRFPCIAAAVEASRETFDERQCQSANTSLDAVPQHALSDEDRAVAVLDTQRYPAIFARVSDLIDSRASTPAAGGRRSNATPASSDSAALTPPTSAMTPPRLGTPADAATRLSAVPASGGGGYGDVDQGQGAGMAAVHSDEVLDVLLRDTDTLMPLRLTLLMVPVMRYSVRVIAPSTEPGASTPPPVLTQFDFDAPVTLPEATTVTRLLRLMRSKHIFFGSAAEVSMPGEQPAVRPPEALQMVRLDAGSTVLFDGEDGRTGNRRRKPQTVETTAQHEVAAALLGFANLTRRAAPGGRAVVYAMDASGSKWHHFTIFSRGHHAASVLVQKLIRRVRARRRVAEQRAKRRVLLYEEHEKNLVENAATLLQARFRGLHTRAVQGIDFRTEHTAAPPQQQLLHASSSGAGGGSNAFVALGSSSSMNMGATGSPSWAQRPITDSVIERAADGSPNYGSDEWLTRAANAVVIQCMARRWMARSALKARKAAVADYLDQQHRLEVASFGGVIQPAPPRHRSTDALKERPPTREVHVSVTVPTPMSGGRALTKIFSGAMLSEMADHSVDKLLWGVHALHDAVNEDFISRRTNCLPQRLPFLATSRWYVSISHQAAEWRTVAAARADLHRRREKERGVTQLYHGTHVPTLPSLQKPEEQSARIARRAKTGQLSKEELDLLLALNREEVRGATTRVLDRNRARDREFREEFLRSRVPLSVRTENPRVTVGRRPDDAHDIELPSGDMYARLTPVSARSTSSALRTGRSSRTSSRVASETPSALPGQPLSARGPNRGTVVVAESLQAMAPAPPLAQGTLRGATGADMRRRQQHQRHAETRLHNALPPDVDEVPGGAEYGTLVVDGPEGGRVSVDSEAALRRQKQDYLHAIVRRHDDRELQKRRVARR